MKWLLTSITALSLVGCSSSATSVASELANDGVIRSVAIYTPVAPVAVKSVSYNFSNVREMTLIEKFAYQKKQMVSNRTKLNRVVKILKSRVGRTPYVFSGSSLYGWDCSGMVRWAYLQLGKELPHSATKQAHEGHRVKTPKVGDIVVFGWKGYSGFYHSAIYIGNGKVVNANRGFKGTYIEPLTDYKGSRIVYVRILDTP